MKCSIVGIWQYMVYTGNSRPMPALRAAAIPNRPQQPSWTHAAPNKQLRLWKTMCFLYSLNTYGPLTQPDHHTQTVGLQVPETRHKSLHCKTKLAASKELQLVLCHLHYKGPPTFQCGRIHTKTEWMSTGMATSNGLPHHFHSRRKGCSKALAVEVKELIEAQEAAPKLSLVSVRITREISAQNKWVLGDVDWDRRYNYDAELGSFSLSNIRFLIPNTKETATGNGVTQPWAALCSHLPPFHRYSCSCLQRGRKPQSPWSGRGLRCNEQKEKIIS